MTAVTDSDRPQKVHAPSAILARWQLDGARRGLTLVGIPAFSPRPGWGPNDCTGAAVYSTPNGVAVTGASPQQVGTANTTAVSTSGAFSWSVRYDSTNNAQRNIPASCHETSSLTITNGGTVSSP